MKKNFFAVIMALCMLITVFSVTAMASDGGINTLEALKNAIDNASTNSQAPTAITLAADITTFVDGSNTEEWAADAMAWAVAEKLINGIENNQLDPQGDATRAQMATILYRFCENVAK